MESKMPLPGDGMSESSIIELLGLLQQDMANGGKMAESAPPELLVSRLKLHT